MNNMRRRALIGIVDAEGIDINNYLTIEALEDGLTAKLSRNVCEYCIDGSGEWVSLAAATATPAINKGQTLSFRQFANPVANYGVGTFTINVSCNVLGDIMSMLGESESLQTYSFQKLFQNCTKIVSAENLILPATTLAGNCYNQMFYGCTSLVNAPALPATTIAGSCYYQMFYNCTSLVNAPVLPALTLVKNCYYKMFYSCSKVSYIKAMFTTTPSSASSRGYTTSWVYKVASKGTFVKNSAATWNVTGDYAVPSGWTIQKVSS